VYMNSRTERNEDALEVSNCLISHTIDFFDLRQLPHQIKQFTQEIRNRRSEELIASTGLVLGYIC